MFSKLTSALSSLTVTPSSKIAEDHNDPTRAKTYTSIASDLASAGVPVSWADCAKCEAPCDSPVTGKPPQIGNIWNGKTYPEYVMEQYGDLGDLPAGFDMDWETSLVGSAAGGRGRVVVISTGKSDWERDHTDETDSLSYHLHQHIQSLKLSSPDSGPKDFTKPPVPSDYIFPPAAPSEYPPSLYSSSLISQSDDPEDQTVLVFPDWKVVQEVENSPDGAASLFSTALDGKVGRVSGSADRKRSWVLPYRAVVLLCSHKRRDKRCHIAAPLLRSALHVVLAKHNVAIDETGASLSHLDGPAIEEMKGSSEEKEAEVARRVAKIEGAQGGEGGEVGIFNINHLGGHRYAGVCIILLPSGAYISYGRLGPQEIPRVVEDTILQGKIVPGLLRNAVGVAREGSSILKW